MTRGLLGLAAAGVLALGPTPGYGQTATAVTVPPDIELRATLGSRTSDPVRVAGRRAAPRIRGVVVLEEQLGRQRGPDAAITRAPFRRNTAYPFRAGAVAGPQRPAPAPTGAPVTERTLFIWGESVGTPADGAPVSVAPHLAYREVTTGDLDAARQQGWSRVGQSNREAAVNRERYQAAIVRVTLEPGVTPGLKPLVFRGVRLDWPLAFSDQKALARFVRESGVASHDPTFIVFPGDVAFLEIAFEGDVGFEQLDLALARRRPGSPDAEPYGTVTASRVRDRAGVVLRTGPIHFRERGVPPAGAPVAAIDVRAGDHIAATLTDPYEAVLVPDAAVVEVVGDPRLLGPTWAHALGRVATCQGEPGRRLDAAFAGESSTVVSRRVFTEFVGDTLARTPLGRRRTELGRRDVMLSKGDHAAALLIRDEFVRLGLLRLNVGRPLGQSIAAQDILRAAEWENRGLLPGIIEPRTRSHDLLWASLARALGTDDCDVEALLVLAGQDAPAVVGSVLQRLVRFDAQARPPRWVPDRLAQAYVRDLKSVGAAVRALDEYTAIDDAFKAMALALGTAGLAATLEVAGASGMAAYALLGGDLADLAIFGTESVRTYLEGERLYGYAQGAAPVLGSDEFVSEAEARREHGLMAAVGLIAPAVGARFGLRDLRDVRSIERGRNLLRGGGDLGDLARFSDPERQDLAAYFAHLDGRAAAGRRLDAADSAALAKFRGYFAQAGAIAPVPGPLPSAFRGPTADVPKPPSSSPAAEGWLDELVIQLESSDLRPLPSRGSPAVAPADPDALLELRLPSPPLPLLPEAHTATAARADWNTLQALHRSRLNLNETLGNGADAFLDPATHLRPTYQQPVEVMDLKDGTFRVEGRTYRRGDLLNPVPANPDAPVNGAHADVFDVVDEAGAEAPFVSKSFGTRQVWKENGLSQRPALNPATADDIEMAADIEYGAGLLERIGIPQAELVHVEFRGSHPTIVQRRIGHRMPPDVVAEETWGGVVERLVRQRLKDLGTPDDVLANAEWRELTDRFLATDSGAWLSDAMAPYRKSVLDARKRMADHGVVWEDGHAGNFFFQRVRTPDGERPRMAVSDQDRMDYVRDFGDGRRPLAGRKTSEYVNFVYQRWRMEIPGALRRRLDRDDPRQMAIASLWHNQAFKIENGRPVDGWLRVSEIRDVFGDAFTRLFGGQAPPALMPEAASVRPRAAARLPWPTARVATPAWAGRRAA